VQLSALFTHLVDGQLKRRESKFSLETWKGNGRMKFSIEHVPENVESEVVIRCHSVDDSVINLINFLETPPQKLLGFNQNRLHILDPVEIFYIESIDSKIFIHGSPQIYESLKKRLYELEEDLKDYNFLRTSKSMIINIGKIESVRPLYDSRLEALLKNGEKVGISRRYVSILKKKIGL
jgi:DNA-binding LytR/AlgR family response regulator